MTERTQLPRRFPPVGARAICRASTVRTLAAARVRSRGQPHSYSRTTSANWSHYSNSWRCSQRETAEQRIWHGSG